MTFGPFRQFVVESSLISYTTATTTGSVYRLLVVKKERSIIMTVCVVKVHSEADGFHTKVGGVTNGD